MQYFTNRDYYDFTVGQVIHNEWHNSQAVYKFIDRASTPISNYGEFLYKLDQRLWEICNVKITSEEIAYLRSTGVFSEKYLSFLQKLQLHRDDVLAYVEDGLLKVEVRGRWSSAIFWEVPLLYTLAGLYAEMLGVPENLPAHREKLNTAAGQLRRAKLNFCEFGTRRRRSLEYQTAAVEILSKVDGFRGTSNVYLAQKYGVPAIGTQSHQLYMGASASGVATANKVVMDVWLRTYGNKLSTVLTDTFTTDVFLRDFSRGYAATFDGVRQDSGDPAAYAARLDNHYEQLGVDRRSKTIYFSDGLTATSAIVLDVAIETECQRCYCIGTFFTNDMKLNLVCKLDELDGTKLCKLSDEPGKTTGDSQAVNRVKDILKLY